MQTYLSYQQPIEAEKKELDEKLAALKKYLFGTGAAPLSPENRNPVSDRDRDYDERHRLEDQYIAMQQYSDILARRIAAGGNLDGTTKITPTPFDAHEQATRGIHVPTRAGVHDEIEGQEYPKAVDHVDHPDGVGKESVVVNTADDEKAYRARKAAETKDEAAANEANDKRDELAAEDSRKEEAAYQDATKEEASTAQSSTAQPSTGPKPNRFGL